MGRKIGLFVLGMALICCSGTLMAQETESPDPGGEGPSAEAGVDFNSAYLWRGLVFNDGWVAQPWLDLANLRVGRVPVEINLWSNFNHGDFGGTLPKNRFSEVDLTVSAELGAGFSAGFVQYIYVGQEGEDPEERTPGTGEVSLSWSKEGILAPTLTLFYDMEEVDGAFFLATLSHTFPLGDKASLELTGELGAASDAFARYYSGTKGGLHEYGATVRFNLQATDRLRLTATAGYAGSLDRDVLPTQATKFYAGWAIAFGF